MSARNRKRPHRKGKRHKAGPRPKAAARSSQAATGKKKASPPMSGGVKKAIGAAVLILVTVGLYIMSKPPGTQKVAPPPLDLTGMEPPAVRSLEAARARIDAQPNAGEAWGQLGALLWMYERPDLAGQYLDQAERLDPTNPRWPHFQSLRLQVASPVMALTKAQRAAELAGPSEITPRYRLARLLEENGNIAEARTQLLTILQSDPSFAPARLLLAHQAMANQNNAEAIQLASQITQDPRTRRAAWSLLANLHLRQNEPLKAEEARQQVQRLQPDADVADAYYAEIGTLRQDPHQLAVQGHNLLAQGQLPQAQGLIETLMREHNQFAETWLLQGRLQILQNRFAEAETSLKRHLELDPESTQGLFQLGTALLRQNRWEDAASQFRQATVLKKDFGPAFFNLGYALARAGKPDEAVAPFEESLKHNPEHMETYMLLTDIYLMFNMPEMAAPLLDKATALNPGDPRLTALRAKTKNLQRQQPR